MMWLVWAFAGCGDGSGSATTDDAGLADGGDGGSGAAILYVDDLDDGEIGTGTEDDPFRNLQDAIDAAADGDTIRVLDGRHVARVQDAIDPTCGNCGDADYRADIPVTVGFFVSGKSVHIEGASRTESILETGAGYGVFFEEAGTSSIESLMVTGGMRDGDGRATNAAIVARYTTLTVRHADIVENNDLYQGEPDPVAGVMGITGREGADLTIVGCRIENNSWDGIALYRSDPAVPDSAPRALIVNNDIACTSQCVSRSGRGVGIGITWDAEATIVHNRIHRYWKGIGSFGESRVVTTNNIVHEQLGWGVVVSGGSNMDVINNVIAANGTTGLAAWDALASGRFINNIIVGNGWNTDEWVGKRTGIWMNAPGRFEMAYNDVWDNDLEDVCSGGYPGADPCTPVAFDGIDGNVSVDPWLEADGTFELQPGSPLIDAGDPDILDGDGSRSDMGAFGGPDARRTEP